MSGVTYRIGPVTIDRARLAIRDASGVIAVEPKVLDCLLHLVEHRDRVVSKDELLASFWPPHVTESVLPRCIAKIRKALGALGAEPIRTVHGRGYQLAVPVVVETVDDRAAEARPVRGAPDREPAPAARGGRDARGTVLVGRADALSRLDATWEAVERGESRVAIVVGDPGIGKTRVAAAAATRAAARGARTIAAHCMDGGVVPPFWPWIELLRSAGAPVPPGLAAPEVGAPTPEARFRLFDDVIAALLPAGGAPTAVLIDDLQWADEGTLALVAHAAGQLRRAPALILVTVRSDPSPPAGLRRALEALRRTPGAERIELGALAVADVAELVQRVLDRVDEAVARRVHERTGGNPLFVEELLRAAHGRGVAPDVVAVPQGVRSAIELQLEPLGDDARRVLALAAIAGSQVELATLAAASGLGHDAAAAIVDRAADAGLARWIADDRVGFRHDLVREALAEATSRVERRAHHRAIAEALARAPSDDPARLEAIARHLAAAGDEHAAAARDHAVRAAEHARASLAYESAAALLQLALEASERAAPEDDATRADLLVRRAEALAVGGDESGARAACSRAADLARRAGRADLLARAGLGMGAAVERLRIPDDEQRRALDEARAGLDADGDAALRALVLSRLANLPPAVEDVALRRRLAADAVDLARTTADRRALSIAIQASIVALWGPDGLAPRAALADELETLAAASDDPGVLAAARDARVAVLLSRGDQLGARHELTELGRLAARLRRPSLSFRVAWLHASAALTEGRFDAAAEHIADAQERADRLGDPFAQLLGALLRANLAYEQGRWDDVALVPEAMSAVYPWAGRVRVALGADVLWQRGEHRDAEAMLGTMPIAEMRAIPRDEHWLTILAVLAMVSVRVGDLARAAAIEEMMLPYEDNHVYNDVLGTNRGSAAFYTGVLAGGLGRWDDALARLSRARAANLGAGIEPGVVRCDIQTGVVLRARGGPGDLERARELGQAAVAACRRLRLAGQLGHALALVR